MKKTRDTKFGTMQLKRYESDKDIDVYAFVNGLYETNFEPVAEILSLSSEELLLQALEEQTGALADEIYNLSVSRNNLSRVQKNLQILNTLPPFGQVFFEYVPERKIDVQKTDYDFFELGHEGYEKMLLHMQNYLHENQLPPSYFINVGTIMEKEYFIKGTYSSHSAFIFVDDLYPEKSSVRTLPQNTYLSVASDNIALESMYAKRLYEEMQRNGMVPCGDYLCEVLTQFPVHQAKQLIYKIQVPVQRIDSNMTVSQGHLSHRMR